MTREESGSNKTYADRNRSVSAALDHYTNKSEKYILDKFDFKIWPPDSARTGFTFNRRVDDVHSLLDIKKDLYISIKTHQPHNLDIRYVLI